MTKIATDFASKLAVAFVAVAMVVAAFAPAAQAQSSEDLQQMINDLLAQVAQLQGTTSTVGSCDAHFFADLGQGTSNGDVMKLQTFLNMDADTRVAAAGSAGSAGMETMYYGPATAAAVSKFQVKYRAEILSPLGLVNPTGYWGASSRAKANAICATGVVVDEDEDEDTDEDTDEDEDEDEEEDFELSGEASLDNFELDDGDSSIEEGDEDVEIGEINLEFTNGDAEISRMDITLAKSGGEPWDAFETISLWVDGDKVAEIDADDEDEYLDEDDGELRFSGLDLIGMEDEELTITVAATVQNNLDADELGDWDLQVTSMRFFDADGVATTETSFDGIASDTSEFEIEEAGENEELNISLSSSNPDSTDIVVDTDSNTDDVTIMVADIEAEDNDIELNRVVVRVDTGVASTSKVVDDIRVIIDGQSFNAENVSATLGVPTGNSSQKLDATGTSVYYVFDIDGDVVIDEDDEVEMEVVVDFNDTDDGVRYANGTTIKASITSTETNEWDAEGADDLDNTQFSGTAVGDMHTLVAEGILVPVDGFSAETPSKVDADGKIYQFQLDFDVTAVEGDYYIYNAATEGASATTGVAFIVTGGTATVTAALDSSADEDTTDVFTVREGETETFTLTVTVDPVSAGTFRVGLTEVHYTEDAAGNTNTIQYDVTPVTDFRTKTQSIAA